MSDFVQLDLFGQRANLGQPPAVKLRQPLHPGKLSDDELIAAIPGHVLVDACALAREAGERRLAAATPALVTLCNRFAGFGFDVDVPEQVAALKALGAIGGREAARAVVQLIVKRVVQGPALAVATTVASQLGVIFSRDTSLALLKDPNPAVRAPACACVRAGPEVVAVLNAMIDDADGEVATAAACALGCMGRAEVRAHLKRLLMRRPSGRVVEALAGVADVEAIVLLARVGRARPELAVSVMSALEDIDNARAASAASALKRFVSRAE